MTTQPHKFPPQDPELRFAKEQIKANIMEILDSRGDNFRPSATDMSADSSMARGGSGHSNNGSGGGFDNNMGGGGGGSTQQLMQAMENIAQINPDILAQLGTLQNQVSGLKDNLQSELFSRR